MIDAVIVLTLVEEMELVDAFVIYVFDNDTFGKLAVAHDRLMMDTVSILTLVPEMKFKDAFVMGVFA